MAAPLVLPNRKCTPRRARRRAGRCSGPGRLVAGNVRFGDAERDPLSVGTPDGAAPLVALQLAQLEGRLPAGGEMAQQRTHDPSDGGRQQPVGDDAGAHAEGQERLRTPPRGQDLRGQPERGAGRDHTERSAERDAPEPLGEGKREDLPGDGGSGRRPGYRHREAPLSNSSAMPSPRTASTGKETAGVAAYRTSSTATRYTPRREEQTKHRRPRVITRSPDHQPAGRKCIGCASSNRGMGKGEWGRGPSLLGIRDGRKTGRRACGVRFG